MSNHSNSTVQDTSRRRFIKNSVATASGAALGFPAVLRSASPNSKLQVASIGVGGMGGNTMKSVASHSNVVITGVCDVEKKTLDFAARNFPEAVAIEDWRELLADHGDKFDAVTVGTPDHSHAGPAVTALRAKKHLYLQKPMAPTIYECRVIADEAKKAGVTTQLGNQGRSSVHSRMAVELIQSGAIGKIKEVIIWENKALNWWPKNTELKKEGDPIPDGFNWDLWLGVRKSTPYLNGAYHPKHWRAWFDFGVGEMGDMGCHHFDPTFDALNLTAPVRVRQTTPGSSGPLWAKHRQVELVFPGTDMTAGDEVKVTWHDGDIRPDATRIPLPENEKSLPESGTCWIGENGTIFKNYRGGPPYVLSEAKFPEEKYPKDIAPLNHYHGWVDAVIAGEKSIADFSHGGPLTETVLVGAMADRYAQEWLEWDSDALAFTGHSGATSLVKRAYRDGWSVPGLG